MVRKYVPLVLAASFACSMLLFVEHFWLPPKGLNYSDLYARWYPARELLLHGRDPYSDAISAEIQQWCFDESRFAYPLYVAFLLAPTVGLSFSQVQTLFCWLLPLVLIGTILLWLSVLRWRCDWLLLACIIVLTFGNFAVLESLYLQQPALLVAALLAGCFAALDAGRLRLAGGLLALATIKPQLTFLLVPWLLLWSLSDWRARKNLAVGFGGVMAALLAGSQMLLPRWIPEFVEGLISYHHYTSTVSVLTLLFGKTGGVVLTIALVAGVALLAWQTRAAPSGSYKFLFTFSMVTATTLVVAPTMYPTGQVLLLPVVYWTLKDVRNIWAEGRWSRLTYPAVWFFIGWQWVAAAVFLLAGFFVSASWLQAHWMLVVDPIVLIPLAFVVFLGVRTRTVLGKGSVVAEIGAAAPVEASGR